MNGIPVAPVYDAFMRNNGIEDPRDQSLMVADGLYPSPDDTVLMAEVFKEFGFKPLAMENSMNEKYGLGSQR